MKIKQIFHHFSLWEDYKAGFYGYNFDDYQFKYEMTKELLGNSEQFKEVAISMIKSWVYSCEQNLSDPSVNKIAYIGQASCCFNHGATADLVKKAWWDIAEDKRNAADNAAKEVLTMWRQAHLEKGSLWQKQG